MNLLQFYNNHRFNRYAIRKYLINDGRKHPFAIICPGGGYEFVSTGNEGKPFAESLNKLGYSAIVVYYRIGKKALYPAPHDDLERAIREAFDHADEWNLDTDNWSLWGSSAGGHLAASFCTEKRNVPKPNALILVYPVITMGDLTHEGSRDNLLGKNPSEEMINRFSVEKNIDSNYPPTYFWCGTADETVDPKNSKMLDEALTKAGVPHRFDLLDGVRHGVGLGDNLPWFNNAVEFWKSLK